jgi:hypothetical protein
MYPKTSKTFLIFICVIFFTSLQAHACFCSYHTMEEAMIEASDVFVGTVISYTQHPSKDLFEIKYRVEKRWKGANDKEVSVWTDNSDCGVIGLEGMRELVIAYKRDGLLEVSSCSTFPREFRSHKFKYDNYDVPEEDTLDALVLLSTEQIKNLGGKIEAKVVRIGNTNFEDTEIAGKVQKKSYKNVELNKGKKDGLYRGMLLYICEVSTHLFVVDVNEESATAVVFRYITNNHDEDIEITLGMKAKNIIKIVPVPECN